MEEETFQWIIIAGLIIAVVVLFYRTPKKEQVDTLENKTRYLSEND
tara:strand:+ start:24996 stop:25133 length:138 start_codon:yes stop_codon:yes gene_type:complete